MAGGNSTPRRRGRDKWIAICLFLLLLCVYLFTGNRTVEQMMLTVFGLVCVAIGNGLQFMVDAVKRRLERSKEK